MRIIETEIQAQTETLNHIIDLARKFQNDILYFSKTWTLREFFLFAQSRYKKEQIETLMRPRYFLEKRLFGDCDDFTILFLAYWFFKKATAPAFLVLCGRERITHVFPILLSRYEAIGLDALPKREYGKIYSYPVMQIYGITTESKSVSNWTDLKTFENFLIDRNLSYTIKEV